MALVKRPFGETFAFSRPIAAPVRNAQGVALSAPADVARFDHDVDGTARGLLIESGPTTGQADILATVGGWQGDGIGTVLHEFRTADRAGPGGATIAGEVRRVALYSRKLKATADACLALAGHHRTIIAVDGFLRNRGGYVRYDGRNWQLGQFLAASLPRAQGGPIVPLILGDSAGRPLIEG